MVPEKAGPAVQAHAFRGLPLVAEAGEQAVVGRGRIEVGRLLEHAGDVLALPVAIDLPQPQAGLRVQAGQKAGRQVEAGHQAAARVAGAAGAADVAYGKVLAGADAGLAVFEKRAQQQVARLAREAPGQTGSQFQAGTVRPAIVAVAFRTAMDGREGHPGILPDSRLAGLLQGRAFHQARAPVEGCHLDHPVRVEGLYLRVGPQAGDGQVDGVTVALHAAVEEQGEALGRIMDGTAVTQGQFIGMDAVYQRVPVTDAHALAPQGPQNAYRTALQVAPCLLIAQCQQGLSGPHAVGQGKVEVLEGRHTPERALPAQQVEAVAAAGSGNSLNLLGWQGTLRRVAAFQYLNLALPNGMRPGETLLTLGNEQTGGDLQGSTVRVLGALGGQGMRIGDRYTLINSIHADELALSNGGTVHDAPKGFALLFDGSMQRNGNSIDLTITGLRANPQIKAFNPYRVVQMAALDRGARLVEGTALEQARKAAVGQDAWMPFAAIHGGTERYGNDGRADGTGLELAAGLARSFTGEAGDLLLGAFFEYGQASIGTREDFSVGDVCGTGSARYAGGGLMARFDLTSGLLSGLYAQAGLRLGQINGDWQSQDIASVLQQTADFDTSTAYYGLFAGLGYQWQATERMRLDSRASFFWNHQDGQDISIMGESVFGNFSFYSYKKACGQKRTVRGSKNSRRLSNDTPAI